MKRIPLLSLFLLAALTAFAQTTPVKFAYLSDIHICEGTPRIDNLQRCIADINSQLETLQTWYAANLKTTYRSGDGYDSQKNLKYITFLPKYYFLGLSNGAQVHNAKLPQTIGWQDYNNGGANGTFDPLAN